MARSFSDLISDISIAEQGSTGSRSFSDLLSALESQSAPARQFSPSFDFVGPVRPGDEYSPEFMGPIAPPSPRDALQRQVDATIAARETSQRYATLPKRVADVYNVYKNEDLAREALDLADRLKIEYPEYGEDIEDLLMKGLRPEDIRTQITQKRERKRRQSELATQYPDFARDVDKLFKEGFSPEDVTLRMEAMAGAKARIEQRKQEEIDRKSAETYAKEIEAQQARTREILSTAGIEAGPSASRVGELTRQIEVGRAAGQDISDLERERRLIQAYGIQGLPIVARISALRRRLATAPESERADIQFLINSLQRGLGGATTEQVATAQPTPGEALTQQLYGEARGAVTGATLGAARPLFERAEQATGGVVPRQGTGETAAEAIGGLATGIVGAGAITPAVSGLYGGLETATRATIGGIQSGVQTAIALAQGADISPADAAVNIGQGILSSALSVPIAAKVPGVKLNAAAQVAGDFVVDLAADVGYRERLKDQSFVDWLLKEELPNLAVSIAGAGKDVLDARAAKTEIRRLFDQRMRSGEATPPPPTGAEPELVARPAGVPEQTPEQRQYVLDQVLMEEAGRANIADYERMMETSRQETARRAEEAKRFQETVKAREAGKQADELLRRLEEARAKKPETEATGEGPVTGVMPEDKYIGKQITAGMIGEREIGALYGRRDQLMKQLEKAKPGIDYDVIQSRLDELNRIIDENKPGATTDYSSADDLRSKLEEKIKGIESYTERRLALEDDARLHGVQFAGRAPEQIISDITRSVERERAIAAGEQIPVPRTEEKPVAPVEKPKQQRAASDIYRRSEPIQEPIVEAKPQEARSAFEIAMARGEEPLARKEDVSEVRPEQVAEPVAKPFNYGDTLEQLDINALREDIKILGYKGGRDRLVAVAEKFGLPTEGTPKQILKKIEEAYNAAKERQVAEGGVGEYRGDGARVQEEGQDRIVTPFIEKGRPEAGGGYRPAPSGNVPPGPVGRGVQGQQAVTPAAGGAVPPTTPPPAAGGAAGAAGAPAPAGRVYTRPAAVGEKISSIFGKIGENIKAQNVAARSLEENRQMGDAASNIGREAFSSIKYIQDKLSKTAGARQVEDDLSKIVENTGSVTVPAATITVGGKQVSFAGGTFSREDIKDMSYSELVEIAKAGGWYNSKMNSADDLKKLALQQTKSDMTVDDFVSKYNLSTDDAQLLKRPFDDAKDFAKTLGAEVEYTGLVDLGNYIASQGAYAQRKYLRNIAKGQFEPTPAARIEAEGVVEQAINRRIDQRSGRLAKIDSKGVNIASYMNTDDPKQAAQIISGLDLDTQRELVDMRDFYRKAMNQAVNVVEQTTPTGRTYTFDKKASDIKTMASHIVDQMVKPPEDALKSPTSGGGAAMDALMKRDLDQVFQRLFGRIKDPAVVMAASRETQANLIGRYQSIRKLAESSELFTDDPVLASQKKWVRLAGSQRSTDPITDNDRKRYGVLAGMHAPESVKALLTNEKYYAASFIPQTIRGVEDALNKVSSVTRGGKVIFAPKSSIRDALTTAVTSSLGSGDIPLNPKQWTKEVSDVYSILRKYAVAKAKGDQKGIAEAQRFFRYLAETGIYKPGSSSYWDDMANAINGEGKISTIWKNLAAGRSYLTDMPFKVAGYNVRYKEALKWGWSEQKAKAWALDNIRRHYDNRDAVPKAFRDVAAKSTSPDYLPFKYSIARARMLQAVDAFSRDLKNKDIPPEAKARIIYGFFASTATTPALAIGKYGNKILKYGGLLSTIYKGTEVMSDNAETADDEVDNAVRYISPGFAQRDPMVTFVDDKDGKKRIITFSLTGAFTANPLEEYALGGYQTAGDKGLSKSMIEKLVEYGAGGDVPMVPNMLYQFLAGEPLGAYYDNEGFPGAVIKSGRALSNAMKLTGDAREEQFSLSKQYGTDALIRLAELATAPLGSVIQTPVKAISMEKRKKELEKEITQERKGGRVPIGYGEEEGRPASDYMPTRTISDMLIQGIAPHNVRIMEERDALFNLRAKAKTLKRYTTDVSDETARAKRELDSEERRKAKKPLLDSYFTDWKEQSEQLLSLFGSKDIRRDQADILAKAGLADWEIEYILGISPPTKSELPGLKNLSGGLKTIK